MSTKDNSLVPKISVKQVSVECSLIHHEHSLRVKVAAKLRMDEAALRITLVIALRNFPAIKLIDILYLNYYFVSLPGDDHFDWLRNEDDQLSNFSDPQGFENLSYRRGSLTPSPE